MATLTLIGGPTILIRLGDATLLTDPTFDPPGTYQRGAVTFVKAEGPVIGPDELPPIDVVLLSHAQHLDNLDTTGRAVLARADRVLTTEQSASDSGDRAVGLAAWESVEIGRGICVTATPARHGPPGIEETLGVVTGFVVEGAGKTIYITGDTVFYEGVAEVASRYRLDVVIAFAGAARTRGPFDVTMNNNDLIELAQAFPDAAVLVAHARGWAHLTETPETIAAAAAAFGLADRMQVLVPGKSMKL